jgi:hypothetical protein
MRNPAKITMIPTTTINSTMLNARTRRMKFVFMPTL